MPLGNLLFQQLVDKFMLLNYCKALEPGRLDFNGVHRSATAAYVLHL